MISIVLLSTGLLSILLWMTMAINSYRKGSYDPSIFKLRDFGRQSGFDYNFIFTIIQVIIAFLISQRNLKLYYFIIWISLVGLTTTILNILSYNRLKRKRIIFETIIIDLSSICILIFLVMMYYSKKI